MKFETLKELVQKRKGWKYVDKNNISPYQYFKYNFRKKILKTVVDTDLTNNCGSGWNLATLEWILNNCDDILNYNIIEFSIPSEAVIIVPHNSEGKFRTDIIKYVKKHKSAQLFPEINKILNKLKKYKPINPITATKMPPTNKIKKIMNQVKNQAENQIRNQIWNQISNQAENQVWNQVWNQVRNQVRNQVSTQVSTQVWNQVSNQVYIIAYFVIKEFMDLICEHPAFDLIKLGIMIISYENKYMVFGKNGKHLGNIDL